MFLESLYKGGCAIYTCPFSIKGRINLNKKVSKMMKVTMDDAYEADAIFTTLMGDDPELRRQFIVENATLVSELDI